MKAAGLKRTGRLGPNVSRCKKVYDLGRLPVGETIGMLAGASRWAAEVKCQLRQKKK